MRCISAIWPAGPPKPRQPIFSQMRSASAKLTCTRPGSTCGSRLFRACTRRTARRTSPCRARAFHGRRVKLSDSPCEIASSPGACGARSRRLVSAPRTMVASLSSAGSFRWNLSMNASKLQRSPTCVNSTSATSYGVAVFSCGCRLTSEDGHVQKLGSRIHEAAHQPRAGDAVDLRPLARHPARCGALAGLREEFAAFLAPVFDAALEVLRAQRLRGVLAHLVAVHAVHDHARALRQGL